MYARKEAPNRCRPKNERQRERLLPPPFLSLYDLVSRLGLLWYWRADSCCRSCGVANTRGEGDYARLVHIEIPVTSRVARGRIGVDAPIRKVANARRGYNPANRRRCINEHTGTTDRELVAALSATSQNRINKPSLGAVVQCWGAYRSAKLSQVCSIAHPVHRAIRRLAGENAA